LSWRAYDEERPGSDLGYSEQIEIVLNTNDLSKMWKPLDFPEDSISGLAELRNLMVEKSRLISTAKSERYQKPAPIEMEFLTDRIIRPLRLTLAREHADTIEGRSRLAAQLGVLQARAKILGFSLSSHTHGPYQTEVLMREMEPTRGWGFFLFRSGASRWVIQVARPLIESGTLEAGLDAYGRFDAFVLMIPGADLEARSDGSSDVTRLDNPMNPYQAVLRGLYPLHPASPEPWILQIRGAAAARSNINATIVSTGEEIGPQSPREPMLATLLKDLRDQNIGWELFNGIDNQIGLKAVDNLQIRYATSLVPQSAALILMNMKTRTREQALDSVHRQLSTLSNQFQLIQKAFPLEDLPAAVSDRPISIDLSKALNYTRRYVETGDPGYWIAAEADVSRQRGVVHSLLRDTISGKTFSLFLNTAESQWCVIRLDKPGGHRKFDPQEESRFDVFRTLRYGNMGSICNAGVTP
jgi:hypothetical protein